MMPVIQWYNLEVIIVKTYFILYKLLFYFNLTFFKLIQYHKNVLVF